MDNMVYLYASVIKIDSEGHMRPSGGFYAVPEYWLIDKYVSAWFKTDASSVTHDMVEEWIETSEYTTCMDVYWDAVDDKVISDDKVKMSSHII